jgi:hypothetical protein
MMMKKRSKDEIARAIAFWAPLSQKFLTDEDAQEILENTEAFLGVFLGASASTSCDTTSAWGWSI